MPEALRLHSLSLLAEDFGEVLKTNCGFFAPFGVEVELVSQGHLIGYPPALPIIITDAGRLTLQQAELYAHRAIWPRGEVVVFFVGSLPPMLCRGFSHPGLNVCLVASGSPILTLAHELGHLLGLKHVDDPGNLMYHRGPGGAEASLNEFQVRQIRNSPLLKERVGQGSPRGEHLPVASSPAPGSIRCPHPGQFLRLPPGGFAVRPGPH